MSESALNGLLAPPQFHTRRHAAALHWTLAAALLPLVIQEIWIFGLPAVLVLLAACATALAADWFLARRFGKTGAVDGHAALAGLLFGLILPPVCPWYVPVTGALVLVAFKWAFGSSQAYPVHPVLVGWAFCRINWPRELATAWFAGPEGLQARAEPFAVLERYAASHQGEGPVQILMSQSDYPAFSDSNLAAFLNDHFFTHLGTRLPAGYLDAFSGLAPTAIGASAGVLVLAISVFVFGRRLASWQAPAGLFTAFALVVYLLGGLPFGQGFMKGDVLFFLGRGSFLFALMLLASDFTSLPFSIKGRWMVGVLTGLLAAGLALLSLSADAPLIALMVGNILVYSINKACRSRRKVRTA